MIERQSIQRRAQPRRRRGSGMEACVAGVGAGETRLGRDSGTAFVRGTGRRGRYGRWHRRAFETALGVRPLSGKRGGEGSPGCAEVGVEGAPGCAKCDDSGVTPRDTRAALAVNRHPASAVAGLGRRPLHLPS